jgi:poly-D-alanine transfer protein DltD
MDLKKEFSKNQTILMIMSSTEYNSNIVDVMKKLPGKNIAYVTLNKTHDSLTELFIKNKIDVSSIVFVDAISKTIKNVPDQSEGVYYVSSPGALTELSLVISKFLRHDFDYLIFDSLTNLLVYTNKAPVAKFVSSLVNKIKESKTTAIFYALSVKEQDALIKESGMFVDKIIDMDRK